MLRSDLGPTQPSIQCIPQALCPGAKWPGREAQHFPVCSVEDSEWRSYVCHYVGLFTFWYSQGKRRKDSPTCEIVKTATVLDLRSKICCLHQELLVETALLLGTVATALHMSLNKALLFVYGTVVRRRKIV
jgi:hypothetical protein